MLDSPLVSVLLPCYNAAGTLDEALDSLACQTWGDYELVIVDDGSTDATPEILQRHAACDPRLHILTLPHAGIIPALTAGLSACRGELIARMDADDRCHPQRLEKQAQHMKAHPEVAVLGCQVRGFPPEQVRPGFQVYIDWQNSLLLDADIRREMFVESPLAHPSVMLRREWLERAGGYQEHGWAEDYDLWLRLYLAGARFAKLPEVLLYWRESSERLTRVDGRYSLENFLRAKVCYLERGPLAGRDAIIVWGAGMVGRRLTKRLQRDHLPLVAFIDINPRKIGQMQRNLPIRSTDELPELWKGYPNPVVLAAVGARGARAIIRSRLNGYHLREGLDWWGVA
jgi:glycosyltransferase involved in cell wall biosynthesis